MKGKFGKEMHWLKMQHKVARVENTRHEKSRKTEYGKPLLAKCYVIMIKATLSFSEV